MQVVYIGLHLVLAYIERLFFWYFRLPINSSFCFLKLYIQSIFNMFKN